MDGTKYSVFAVVDKERKKVAFLSPRSTTKEEKKNS
jgi:hypothetical protein